MSDPISTIGIAQLHQQVTTLEAVVETNTKAIDNLADLLATAIKQNTLMASVTELSARMADRMTQPPSEAHQALCDQPEDFL